MMNLCSLSADTSTAAVSLSVSVNSCWSLLPCYFFFLVESLVLTSIFGSICSYGAGSRWLLQLLGVTGPASACIPNNSSCRFAFLFRVLFSLILCLIRTHTDTKNYGILALNLSLT